MSGSGEESGAQAKATATATATATEGGLLQFQPFNSAVDVAFWHELNRRKLEVYRLDESGVELRGQYGPALSERAPALVSVGMDSFNRAEDFRTASNAFLTLGTLRNTNTMEAFKAMDKQALLDAEGQKILAAIDSEEVLENPALLNRFLVLSFSDLKKYLFTYWFAFPALGFDQPIRCEKTVAIDAYFTKEQTLELQKQVQAQHQPQQPLPFFFIDPKGGENGAAVRVGSLAQWKDFISFDANSAKEVTVGFFDPCMLKQHPGWPLRNFLVLLARRFGVRIANVVAYRERKGVVDSSIVLRVLLPEVTKESPVKVVGWEKDTAGKNRPRLVNLGSTMDPLRLATNAVDLNLQLMRWRLLPAIDLELIASTKCLLLGSGTLGCNVARTLLGWGVKKITMVDNGVVSFSNPVRQTLYEFTDCLEGGKPKALAAADHLKKIYPGVDAEGHQLSIPMPGHPISNVDSVTKDVEKLTNLVKEHDVVFLLMDSRESRWLPTVLANIYGKIAITTALGFDTFLVMRHGQYSENPELNRNRLACYFCNDVVAPQDSMKDRTLDQQCTVTRPGLSGMSSSLAVELLVSLLHHPQGIHAPSDNASPLYTPTTSPLGLVPHQLRGFITHFTTLLLNATAFEKCVACSDRVVHEYKEKSFEFLRQVCDNPTFLEDLTGLTEMKQATFEDIQWDDEDAEDASSKIEKENPNDDF